LTTAFSPSFSPTDPIQRSIQVELGLTFLAASHAVAVAQPFGFRLADPNVQLSRITPALSLSAISRSNTTRAGWTGGEG
jgi:hypothetical protein